MMGRSLFVVGFVFALIGAPLLVAWFRGEFAIFWTVPGAALFQAYGCAATCWLGALGFWHTDRKYARAGAKEGERG
jgi:hypothetical protein